LARPIDLDPASSPAVATVGGASRLSLRGQAEEIGPISPCSNGRNGRLSPFIIAQNGLWLCAAMAGHTRPARSLGVGKRLPGQLRGAGDKRQETYDTGGGDGHDRYPQRPLQQQPS